MLHSHTFWLNSHVILWTSQNTSHPDHVCDNHLIATHIIFLSRLPFVSRLHCRQAFLITDFRKPHDYGEIYPVAGQVVLLPHITLQIRWRICTHRHVAPIAIL